MCICYFIDLNAFVVWAQSTISEFFQLTPRAGKWIEHISSVSLSKVRLKGFCIYKILGLLLEFYIYCLFR